MEEIRQIEEKVILVAVSEQDGDDTKDSLEELRELVKTAGAATVGIVIQNRAKVHPGYYVGTGKVEEIKAMVEMQKADGIVCDDELSPAQMKNLEDMLNVKVMDRTLIILDIFAKRATTSEGKIQVELAQLRYSMTRLTGFGKSMSRLGGGIGTRGPGEKKLEVDKRIIKERITQLRQELLEVKRHRDITRAQRQRNQIPVAAIVGYTNAGKSTLLNHLTQAGVLEEDKLFATLDPTTRMLELAGKQQILLTDTVGFIRKLPHHLIEAFKSTLEEAKYADFIIHVVDASNPQAEKQMHIVYETLLELEIKNKTILTLFNKQDKLNGELILRDFKADKSLKISAKSEESLNLVKETLSDILRGNKEYLEQIFPFEQGNLIAMIRKSGELISEEYLPEGILVKAYVPKELKERLK